LRGNSGSGKSAVAAGIRLQYGVRRLAIVGQDNLRRTVLRERDVPGGVNVGLIEHTAAYALEAGFHAIVEGIMYADRYGEMLHRLRAAHAGPSFFYYFDVPFEETLRRHAGKPQAAEYGRPEMARWWREKDLLPGGIEDIITAESTLDETVTRIMRDTGLDGSGTPAPAGTPPQSPVVPLPEPAMWQSVSKLHAYHRGNPARDPGPEAC